MEEQTMTDGSDLHCYPPTVETDFEGINVFVYGTLKQGFCNNRLLQDCRLIGDACTIDTFRMYDVGFPVVFLDPDGHYVKGELWRIPWKVSTPVIRRLDILESEGSMYSREKRAVRLFSDIAKDIDASMYVGIPQNWPSLSGMRERAVSPRDGVHLVWPEK